MTHSWQRKQARDAARRYRADQAAAQSQVDTAGSRPRPAIRAGHARLDLTGAKLANPGGPGLTAEGNTIGGSMFCGQFPDRDREAGTRVAGPGMLLIAARNGAYGLQVRAGVDPYTTTFF